MVAVLDLVAAGACVLAALRRPASDRSGRAFWLLVAALTLLLGLNKQGDLQRRLLPWGRSILDRRSAAIRDLVAWSWASWLVRMLGGGPRRETA